MDLSAVARQRVSRRGEESASGRTRTTEDDDDDDDDLDQEEAKALVRDFIKHALDGVRHGARAQYYELLEALTGLEKPDVSQDKLLMLTVLVECVSSLDERLHESLLQRVLGTSLWRCGPEVGRLVLEFCVNLVSTHTGSLLQACLDVLVSSFAPPPGYDLDALASDGRGDGGWGAGAPSATRVRVGLGADPDASDSNPAPPSPATVSAAIVGAVETILKLVPLAASVLRPVLLSRLPHKSVPGATQAWYLRSACKLVETSAGAPLRDALLRGVVAHLLELDVEIKWEDIRQPGDESSDDEDVEDDADVDGLDGKDGGAGIFELEDIERTIEEQLVRQAAEWERGTGGHGNGRGGHSPSHHGHDAAVDETADALDSMMEVTVAHVDARVDRGGAEAAAACDALLSTFVGVLLPAHRSKFTQFLLFHACARDAAREKNANGSFTGGGDLSSRVVDVLIERLTDPHHPPAGRLASAAYLASFLARAAFLSPAFLAETLRRLAKWCLATARAAASGAGVVGVAGDTGARDGSGTLARGFGSSFKIASESGGGETDSGGGDGAAGGGDGGEDAKKSLATRDDSEEYANASAATLAVFDSACQALMYVLCYRMEDVLRLGGEPAAELRRLPLREILYSRLQPLHTCLPSVVGEFLHRAVAAGMEGFDAELLERHKREKKEKDAAEKRDPNAGGSGAPTTLLRTTSSAALGSEVAEAVRHRRPLRMFFPFDPYLLRRSAALLRLPMTYVTWQGSAQQDEDDDEDLDLDGEDDEGDGSESDDDNDDSDDESGGRAGSRSGSHGFGPHGSFNSSLPNSLNPRPRKLTRGLLGPQPLFGGKSASPVFGGGLGPGPGPGAGAGAASNPIVGFGVGSGIGNIGVGSAGGYAGAAGGGVPLAFGGNSPGESRGSPSPLGASPLSGGGAFPGSIGSVGGSGSGGKGGREVLRGTDRSRARNAAEVPQTKREVKRRFARGWRRE